MTSWIIPCNLKYYDVIGAFKKFKILEWKQSAKSIVAGDLVFIYVGKPVSAIRYKCKANKVNISKREIDDREFIVDGDPYISYGNYMEIELLEEYPDDYFSLKTLFQHGLVGNIQGPRRAEGKIESFLNSKNFNRLDDEIIEITGIIEDGDKESKIQDIKPVYIENVKYIGREYLPYEGGTYDLYEGDMYFYRFDGSKKYLSRGDSKNKKRNITYYKVNPVKILYISDKLLRVVSTDFEGLYCYDNFDTYPRLEITDREPGRSASDYKDILFVSYELEGKKTANKELNITVREEDNQEENTEEEEELESIHLYNEKTNTDRQITFEEVRELISIHNKNLEITDYDTDLPNYVAVEQKKVIEAAACERILVNAGPGTGKTWTLIEKVIYMVKELGIEAENIQVLCFSRAAVEVIRKRIEREVKNDSSNLDINRIDVRTFDSFATQLLYWVRESEYEIIPEDYPIERLDYEERIQLFTNVIDEEPELISSCNHLVVDEVQDLVLARADMVLTMIRKLPDTCGITLLGDSCQAIYDYQLEKNATSLRFYKEIKRLGEFKYYSFTENHRQTSELMSYSDGYRKCILDEDGTECQEYLSNLRNIIPECELALGKVDLYTWGSIGKDEFNAFYDKYQGGSFAILTRNNAQALKLSGTFRKCSIEHRLLRRLNDKSLCSWIALILNKNAKKSYNYVEFCTALEEYRVGGINELWEFFSDGVNDTRIDTKEILRKIVEVGSCPLLYINEASSKMTISTIHRSKGREYDCVIVLDDLLDDNTESVEEHRVKYVALSRAKNKVFHSSMDKIYFRTLENRRCYSSEKSFKNKSKYLSYFEVGLKSDLDIDYFVYKNDLQDWIRENADNLVGQEVWLKKAEEKINGEIHYYVFLPRIRHTIGITSKDFYMDLTRVIRKIKGLSNYYQVYDYLYPAKFRGIYITDIVSEISITRGIEKGVEDFGGMTTWNTIQIAGYAMALYQ